MRNHGPSRAAHRAAVVIAAALLTFAGQISASVIWTFELTNNTGETVSDFHGTFAFTGEARNPKIVVNCPGCETTIGLTGGNTINLSWSDPFFEDKAAIVFSFESDHPVPPDQSLWWAGGTWTFDGIEGGGVAIPVEKEAIKLVPEPATSSLLIAGLMTCFGYAFGKMKRYRRDRNRRFHVSMLLASPPTRRVTAR